MGKEGGMVGHAKSLEDRSRVGGGWQEVSCKKVVSKGLNRNNITSMIIYSHSANLII